VPAATPLPRGPSVLTLYSAADLLTAPGCPICRYATEASDRYLRWFALEGHAQPSTITRLCAGLGMCAAHTRRLMSQPGSAVRLTAVYRYVVTAARGQLDGPVQPPTGCPGCEHDNAAARRALDTLTEDLTETAVMDRCRELGGLCLPHLASATVAARPVLIAPLADSMQRVIATPGARCDWLAGADYDAENRAMLRRSITSAGSQSQAACSPCFAAAQAEQDALARLPGLARNGPDYALALCADHLADAAAEAGAHGLRPLLAWQAQCVSSRLSAGRARWPRRTTRRRDDCLACTVCRARTGATRRALTDLSARLRQDAAGGVLCVRHHLTLRAADLPAARKLSPGAVERASWLATELAEAFDRAAWAHSHGARAPESTAWRQAASFLDGSVFGGLSWPLPAGSLPHR
jgi:hypothetical protein